MTSWKDFCRGREYGRLPLVGDLRDPRLPALLNEGDFLYADNAYFDRAPHGNRFRLIRGGTHLTKMLERPADRFERLGKKVAPWRKSGEVVVVIPPSPFHQPVYREALGWVDRVVARIGAATDRRIFVKVNKVPSLQPLLANTWALVTFASAAAVEATLAGVPVFSTPLCCSWPINAGTLEQIETPTYHDREPWLHGLAYAQWTVEDVENKRVDWDDYDYLPRAA